MSEPATTASADATATKPRPAKKLPPAKKAKRAVEPEPPPPPPPELWPERVLNLVYVGHRPNRGDFYPDADEPAARLSLLRISELPAWMREIIETEYDEVVDDEELPSDDEGSGRSFGHDFNDAGGLDIEWTDPDDAASWFYNYMPCRDRAGMLNIVTSSDIEMSWHAVNALMKIDPKKDDEEDGLQTKRWCDIERVALKKALRSAVYQMFDPDVVGSVDQYLDARTLHELGKRKRGVDAVATITIHLDKWVDEKPQPLSACTERE